MAEIHAQLRATGTTEGIAEREEMLLLAIYTAASYSHSFARIKRHADRPPTLGAWEDQPGDSAGGVMMDPLQQALRRQG